MFGVSIVMGHVKNAHGTVFRVCLNTFSENTSARTSLGMTIK